MSRRDRIRIAVIGELGQTVLDSSAQAVVESHSFALEIEQFDPKGADPGTLMDLLEVLQKAGYSAVELRDPVTQVLTPLTEWTTSANEAGIVDSLCFEDSDVGMPAGHNLSYLASGRVIEQIGLDVRGESFMLVGDSVSTHGVSAALLRAGAENVRTGPELEVKRGEVTSAGDSERVLDIRHGGGIGFEALDGKAEDPTARDGFRRLFWAERLRQIIKTCHGPDLPFSFSRELSGSAPIKDGR